MPRPRKPRPSREVNDHLGLPQDSTIGTAHLAIRFGDGSAATPELEAQYVSREMDQASVDTYDVEAMKKRLIVMFMEAFYYWMRSPHTPLEEKVNKGLAAMGQWEGTRRIIEWDKRKPLDKDLLARSDKIVEKLMEIRRRLSPEQVAQVQLKAAEVLLGDLGLPPERQKTNVLLSPLPGLSTHTAPQEEPTNGRNERSVEGEASEPPGSGKGRTGL